MVWPLWIGILCATIIKIIKIWIRISIEKYYEGEFNSKWEKESPIE